MSEKRLKQKDEEVGKKESDDVFTKNTHENGENTDSTLQPRCRRTSCDHLPPNVGGETEQVERATDDSTKAGTRALNESLFGGLQCLRSGADL